MIITKRQLRRIVKEEKRRLNEGGLAGHFTGQIDTDMERTQYEEYRAWVKETGQVTPAASSVMATYFVEQGLENDHELHELIAGRFGVDHDDVMRDIKRQQAEYEAGGVMSDEESYERSFKEGKVKITKRQLRRIIREAVTDTTHAVQRNYTDASGKRQFVPAGRSQAQRAADRYRVRSGNLSSANWNDPVNNPQTAADWKNWSKTFNLDIEHDNEGQIILYIDDDTPDGEAIAKEAGRAGADVQTLGGQTRAVVIYTGSYDENY